jgi:four helix bundle protein
VYQATAHFPREETFGLSAQLRRAAASVPASLVEGSARNNRTEYRELIGDAKASAAEARYHLLLARDLGYVAQKDCDELRERYDHACRMLAKLAQALAGPGRSQAATPSPRQ